MKDSRMWCVVGVIAAFTVGCGGAIEPGPKVEADAKTSAAPVPSPEVKRGPKQEADAKPSAVKGITIELGRGVTLELVLIPAGSFTMGDERGKNDDRPAREVTITKPFYLGKFEVTQEQWQAVMGDNPSRFKGPKNPVERVSWDYCQSFLKKLNGKLDPVERRFRLPTEAEWEYACRAGSTGPWCFGDDERRLGDYAWYIQNAGNTTHAVGQKKPNAWGLCDMHGNVEEWCADWFWEEDRPINPRPDDPAGLSSRAMRVLRGGCFSHYGGLCRSAYRCGCRPFFFIELSGFRLARDP